MTKSSNVLIRNEHVATAKEEIDDFGLGMESYVKFCRDLEACRNEKGRWDYNKVKAFAKKLSGISKTGKVEYEEKIEETKHTEEYDPLGINPWVKGNSDDSK